MSDSDNSTGDTGTGDLTYDLVSILFHALQGAETYDIYIEDAEEARDTELADFFRQVKAEEENRAEQCKRFLARRLQGAGGGGGGGGR